MPWYGGMAARCGWESKDLNCDRGGSSGRSGARRVQAVSPICYARRMSCEDQGKATQSYMGVRSMRSYQDHLGEYKTRE